MRRQQPGARSSPGASGDAPTSSLTRATTIVLLTIFSLLTLWDFYMWSWGVRPFDLLSFGILCGLIPVVTVRIGSAGLGVRRDVFLIAGVAALSVFYLFVGIFLDAEHENAKRGIGFIAGLPFLYVFRQFPLDTSLARRWISWLIVAHCAALVMQQVYFYQSGTVFNPMAAFGMDVRALSTTFRPTGLYQEPSNFAVSMSLLLVARLSLNPRFDLVIAAGFLSILATFSLWGLWCAPALLATYIVGKKQPVWPVAVAAAIVGGVAIYRNEVDPQIAENVDHVSTRVDEVRNSSDASAQIRYSGLLEVISNPDKWEIGDVFGTGLSPDYHRYGSNGYAPLLKAGGICGLAGFWALLSALGGAKRWRLLYFLIVFGSAAPMWTWFFWWSWIGLVSRPDSAPSVGVQPATPYSRASAWNGGGARRQPIVRQSLDKSA
jgi:hypothetical protein